MSKSYLITYSDDAMTPEYLERGAAYHGIPPEMYIKRWLSLSIKHMHPDMQDISGFDNLDEFFIANGLRKSIKNRWHTLVLMTEPENPLLVRMHQRAEQLQMPPEQLALQLIAEGMEKYQQDEELP